MKTEELLLSNEDNMELMSRYKDNYFDLAIVDPPYGIGDTWSKSRKDRFYKKGKLHQYQNESIPSQEYFESLFRVSKNQIIWGVNYFTEYLPATNSWIIWDKNRQAAKTFMSEAEIAWTSFSKVMRIARYQWDGAKKCEVVNKWHPHQKPWSLYEWVLANYAEKGQKILDTHLGSMSIAIAVHNCNEKDGMNLHLTGCELDKEYFKSGVQRVKNAVAQTTIFS